MERFAMNTVGIAFPTIHRTRDADRAMCGARITNSAIRADVVDSRFGYGKSCRWCFDAYMALKRSILHASWTVAAYGDNLYLDVIDSGVVDPMKVWEARAVLLESSMLARELESI